MNNLPLEYHNLIKKYEKKLEENKLPIIYSLKHFSLLIDIDVRDILYILKSRDKYYRYFKLEKKNKSNGFRIICTPNDKLKYIQKSIKYNILDKLKLEDSCKGFRKEYSIKNNAEVHQNQEMILKIDLYRFFDSISEKRVFGLFHNIGYHKNLSVDLAKLTTVFLKQDIINDIINDKDKPNDFFNKNFARLPQGAPTSPVISNLLSINLDKRLNSLANKYNLKYTRYADDITFSGEKKQIKSLNLDLIDYIIKEEGFFINKNKISYKTKGQKQYVTGLSVSEGIHVPKKFKNEIRQHLYYCKKFGVKNHLIKIGKIDKQNYKNWLLGKISYIYSIEKKYGKKLFEDFNKINWNYFD